jgi:outer membrane protein assembly factor BamA
MRCRDIVLIICCLISSCINWANAQETEQESKEVESRADQIEAEREAKSLKLQPPVRNKVERFMYWYDNQYVLPKVMGGYKGLKFSPGRFPAGAGMKFGLDYTNLALFSRYADDDLPNRLDLNLYANYSTRDYSSYGGNFAYRNIGGVPVDFLVGGGHYRYPEEDFFGLGQDSQEENRTNYLMESTDFNADAQWRPHPFIFLSGGASYLGPDVTSGKDDRYPSVEEVFPLTQLPGFSQQPDFLRLTGKAAFDWRDNPEHPHSGGLYSVSVSDYQDRDLDLYDFQLYQIEVHQYIPLPNRYRIIALRAASVLTDSESNQEVPFYYMPTLGGARDLRGFREGRFRDQNSLVLTAEYRWEAWWALDGAFFIDAGQVAARRQDLKFSEMDVSYGFGLRFHSNKKFVLRFDFCFSREGFIPMLRWENAF